MLGPAAGGGCNFGLERENLEEIIKCQNSSSVFAFADIEMDRVEFF